MTTGHVFIAASIDGYIARKDGDISWLTTEISEGADHGYAAFYDSIDGIIMGRGTWEIVAGFDPWPFDKPVIVLSNTLTGADLSSTVRGKMQIWNLTPTETMQRVSANGWKRAYIDGGKLIQSFLAAGLIDDLILSRVPVLLGDGLPLFGSLPHDITLRHLRTGSYPSGLVQSHYQVEMFPVL